MVSEICRKTIVSENFAVSVSQEVSDTKLKLSDLSRLAFLISLFNPLTVATSLGIKRFRVFNTMKNIKYIL
jgi:hypothetical protein